MIALTFITIYIFVFVLMFIFTTIDAVKHYHDYKEDTDLHDLMESTIMIVGMSALWPIVIPYALWGDGHKHG